MTITIGTGDHVYSPQENWAFLALARLVNLGIRHDVAAVGVSTVGRIGFIASNRGPHPMS